MNRQTSVWYIDSGDTRRLLTVEHVGGAKWQYTIFLGTGIGQRNGTVTATGADDAFNQVRAIVEGQLR